jgi:hypothetical protein
MELGLNEVERNGLVDLKPKLITKLLKKIMLLILHRFNWLFKYSYLWNICQILCTLRIWIFLMASRFNCISLNIYLLFYWVLQHACCTSVQQRIHIRCHIAYYGTFIDSFQTVWFCLYAPNFDYIEVLFSFTVSTRLEKKNMIRM